MDRDQFVAALVERLRAMEGCISVEMDAEEEGFLLARFAQGGNLKLNPFNFWRSANRGDAEFALGQAMIGVAAMRASQGRGDQPWDKMADRVFARLERHDVAKLDRCPHREWPASPALRECLVEDLPDALRRITDHEMGIWSVDPDEVYARGRLNLRRLVDAGPKPQQCGAHLWALDVDDGYGASRLLFPDWLEQALPARHRAAGWVLSAPTRNHLLAVPMSYALAAVEIIAVGDMLRQSRPNPWPRNAIFLIDGALVPLEGPTSPPPPAWAKTA